MNGILLLLNFCRRRWSDENEFFEESEGRRLEKSRGGFVGVVDSVGSPAASSAQLKRVETSDSGCFVIMMEVGDFSIFWWFFMKPADSGLILKVVGTGDSLGGSPASSSKLECAEFGGALL